MVSGCCHRCVALGVIFIIISIIVVIVIIIIIIIIIIIVIINTIIGVAPACTQRQRCIRVMCSVGRIMCIKSVLTLHVVALLHISWHGNTAMLTSQSLTNQIGTAGQERIDRIPE